MKRHTDAAAPSTASQEDIAKGLHDGPSSTRTRKAMTDVLGRGACLAVEQHDAGLNGSLRRRSGGERPHLP